MDIFKMERPNNDVDHNNVFQEMNCMQGQVQQMALFHRLAN